QDGPGPEVRHNIPGTPFDANDERVRQRALDNLVGEPVWLNAEQAGIVGEQFRQTAAFRGWVLLAVAVMANHVHLVVGVPGDPDPEKLLGDFKAWGTRRLNQGWGRRDHWWTESGSRRRKKTAAALRAAIEYVRDQPCALVVW